MLCRFHPVKSHRPTAADPSRAERGCRDSRCKVCRRSLPNRCFTATRSHPRCASRRPNARPSSSPSSPSRVASASASLHSEWPTRRRTTVIRHVTSLISRSGCIEIFSKCASTSVSGSAILGVCEWVTVNTCALEMLVVDVKSPTEPTCRRAYVESRRDAFDLARKKCE